MESISNYWLFWAAYLIASAVFCGVLWKVTGLLKTLWLPYLLRSVSAAIIFTPWYTNSQESLLAPALMIMALDGMTVGSDAAIRAMVPLILSIILSIIIAVILIFLNKKKLAKKNKNNELNV